MSVDCDIEKNNKNTFYGLAALSSLCVRCCVLVFKKQAFTPITHHFSHPQTWLQDLESKNIGFSSLKNVTMQ
jgi:hypothetical protein